MSIPGVIVLWVFLVFAGVLLITAVTHVYFGLRYGAGSKAMAFGSAIFIGFIILAGWLSWSLLKNVDWSQDISAADFFTSEEPY